jgi:hypothetical protein
MSDMRRYVVTALVPLAIAWLLRISTQARVSEMRGRLVFRSHLVLRITYALGVIFFSSLFFFTTVLQGKRDWWVGNLTVFFVLLALYSWPQVIIVTESGVSSNQWWRPIRTIPFGEIGALVRRTRDRTIFVYAKDGSSIQFSPFQGDSERFAEEIRKKTGITVASDEDAPTLGVR